MEKDFFRDKVVVVMGLGQFAGGLDSAVFASGAGAKVIVTDLADEGKLAPALGRLSALENIEYHLSGHRREDFTDSDIIIVNPAVAPDNEFLQIAKDSGRLITSQIEIFFQLCPAEIIGITGSNGKSTTAALTAHLLNEAVKPKSADYENVFLGGNIGNKPLLGILDEIVPSDLVVLEISSFQIDQLTRLRRGPSVALVTNLTPNHLDRHGTFEAYCQAKENLFKFQKLDANHPAVSIFNAQDTLTSRWYNRYSKEKQRRCFTFDAADVPDKISQCFNLPGPANLSNLAAAMTVARYFGLSDESIAGALATFETLDNRLQLIAQINGVNWYDDSIATTPDSAIAALNAFDQPKIIIAGGYDKDIPFDVLGAEIASKAKAAILLGSTARKIADAVKTSGQTNTIIKITGSMTDAVNSAAAIAESGDVVLLSPACASYDMFDNYRQRGEVFKKLVKTLDL